MFQKLKKNLYFVVAWYFCFFAEIKLKIWNPKIVVVAGSTGKTTLLNLIESQLGTKAKYSHHANSAIGIPFDILGLHRIKLTIDEWPMLIISAPFKTFTSIPKENIYIVEADCDRPGEGKFLSSLLNPEVTLLTNVGKAHSINFDHLVRAGKFITIEDAIAYEFGFFIENTSKLALIDEDDDFVLSQAKRATCVVEKISGKNELKKYTPNTTGTIFDFGSKRFDFKYLLPKESATSILMCQRIVQYFGFKFDRKFSHFRLPPGRSSVFKGIKGITIVDSAYNANFDSMKAVVNMFAKIESKQKWVVLGDMLEQGDHEKDEHVKLAKVISDQSFQKIILMGPRVSKYTYPLLKKSAKSNVEIIAFDGPREVLDHLKQSITGNEIVLFKGARFLEGVIENLLLNKGDVVNLDRREKVWEIRRKKWGL